MTKKPSAYRVKRANFLIFDCNEIAYRYQNFKFSTYEVIMPSILSHNAVIFSELMTMNLSWGNEVDSGQQIIIRSEGNARPAAIIAPGLCEHPTGEGGTP